MIPNRMRPIHPGEILREEYLIPMGMSANAFAHVIKVPANRMSEILREKRGVTADTALRLAHVFSTTPTFWLNLQTAYDLRVAETSKKAKKISSIKPLRRKLQPA
jgi:antitoxin HigA-1